MTEWMADQFRDAIEKGLQTVVSDSILVEFPGLSELIRYHMGWEGKGSGKTAQGKRLRPLMTLLTIDSAGGDWKKALPSALAVEFLHNYSLVHDDIEDRSDLRRSRPTLWHLWGEALAINAGDALYSLAFRTLAEGHSGSSFSNAEDPVKILADAALALTGGQHLDISFEGQRDIRLDDYWKMAGGKTAALFAACTSLGALNAEVVEQVFHHYREFGRAFGMAFQAKDDWLGIWGDSAVTGKSTESDLVSGKKSLSVVFGLEKSENFRKIWFLGPIGVENVPEMAELLRSVGAESYVRHEVNFWMEQSLEQLEASGAKGKAAQILREYVEGLNQFYS
jgi:geranylgeranyl diphosphate synthase type I